VRGYLLGSGWKDYQKTGSVCGIELPSGLKKNHKFDPALFTPSTKAQVGHDENISKEQLSELIGAELSQRLSDLSIQTYQRAATHAYERGIVICDTKLEWGEINGSTTLVDEVLTPDSSRFWRLEDAQRVLPDGDPPSYDKQVVRDYLETLTWDKKAPGPLIPAEVLSLARSRYVEIYERICGRSVPHL
jgi:phosphoribosylaminoimidazole-succinocarboxamide synthase